MYRIVLLLFCVFLGVQSTNLNFEPCKKHDNACLTKLIDKIIKLALDGDPLLDMESLDPMFQDHVEGKFTIMKYQLHNSTVEGFKNCQVTNAKAYWDRNVLKCKIYCPYLFMYGLYEVSGKLIIVPIEGKGDYRFDAKDYNVTFEADANFNKGNDGKNYLSIKSFKLTSLLGKRVLYDIKNLFNGQHKDLADAALKFANEQWQAVAEEFQMPIFYKNIKRVIKNMNKYLKHVPFDKLIV